MRGSRSFSDCQRTAPHRVLSMGTHHRQVAAEVATPNNVGFVPGSPSVHLRLCEP